jgi:hypothetical protein
VFVDGTIASVSFGCGKNVSALITCVATGVSDDEKAFFIESQRPPPVRLIVFLLRLIVVLLFLLFLVDFDFLIIHFTYTIKSWLYQNENDIEDIQL